MEPPNSSSLGAMGSVLKKLDDLRTGDEQEQGLIDNLGTISTNLKNLSEVHDPPLTVKYWMTDARELSYDMEVCLDQFIHASQQGAMSAEVASIKEVLGRFTVRVEEVMERFERYNLVNRYVPRNVDARLFSCKFCEKNYGNSPRNDISTDLPQNRLASVRPTEVVMSHNLQNLYMEAEPLDPIGMEDPSKLLDEWLKLKGHGEGDLVLKTVSVLGDGGVGKSTLVKRLWRASEGKFDCRAFVQMSKKPDMMMVLRSILSQVRPKQPSESFDVRNLIQDLKKHLQDKRYLIIIDDLWDVSAWHIIGRAFRNDNYRIVIITTAVENIAQECCSYDRNSIVNVKRLQEDQSKKLFVDTAFGSAEGYSPQFNDVIDRITRKCGGLPLAITCTARLVGRSQAETEKKQLLDYVNTFLHDNLRTHSSSKEILNQVLKLCYSSLPHCLKTCLLYLSVYPENYSFLKEDLVKQWIAEDFICTQEKKESVALSYFELLLNLGLIQRMDIINSEKKRLLYYTVHPVVFDFITCKSMEDNFVRIIDYSQSKMVLTEKIRRLSLHFGGATYATIPAGVGLSQVRTLSFMGLLGCLPSLEKFEFVRVLIFHLWGDDRNKRFYLINICELRLLRYLQVRSNVVVELPGQMQCLEHLETLDINAEVSAVPSNILHNPRLTYIYLGRKTKQKNMVQGRVTPSQLIFPENLVHKKLPHPVQVFELLPPICSFSRLPETITQLTKLRILEVVVRELGTDDLDHLGKLQVLTVLSLYVRKPATQRRTIQAANSQSPFPALEYFKFVSGLVLLNFPEKAMPKLRKLKICFNARGGEKYSDMLHGIHHLENLHEVVAHIGTSNGDEDCDFRKDTESAFEQAIQELKRMRSRGQIRHNVKWVDKIDEEYDPREPSNKWGEISEQNEDSTEQHDESPGKLPIADRTHTPLPPVKDDSAATSSPLSAAIWRQSQKEIWTRLGPASHEYCYPMSSLPSDLTFNLLESITNSFSEDHKIGEGSYGEVYKGVLQNGEAIAVKKLYNMHGLDDVEFEKEVYLLRRVHHKNIIRLVGYCYGMRHNYTLVEGEVRFAEIVERALCFEYLQHGSLDKHLSDVSCGLDWHTRYKIIKGICEGLNYLHNNHIYHLDLKPANILLDENMTPKITDFGLSRLFGTTQTHVTKNFRGTLGYVPPEFINKRQISERYDIFSLGVIIIEIMTGPSGYSKSAEMSTQQFMELVHENWKNRWQATPMYTPQEEDSLKVKTCIQIALDCVKPDQKGRPTITEVVDKLNEMEALKLSHLGQSCDTKGRVEIDPVELRFPFEPNKELSCVLRLMNKSDEFIAFSVKTNKYKYYTKPDKGILQPCSMRYVIATMRAQERLLSNMQCNDMFIVENTTVGEGLTDSDITEQLFAKMGPEVVDEVKLRIICIAL